MKDFNFYPITRSSNLKLGKPLAEQLLEIEREFDGIICDEKKQTVLETFRNGEPDLFSHFESGEVTPLEFLMRVQKAYEDPSATIISLTSEKDLFRVDASSALRRYLPNLSYLDTSLYITDSKTIGKTLQYIGESVLFVGGLEVFARELTGEKPFFSMESAVLLSLLWTAGRTIPKILSQNRCLFSYDPWDCAIYTGAHIARIDSGDFSEVTWNNIPKSLFKTRPRYKAIDDTFVRQIRLNDSVH